jgi:transcription elongation factor GreA
MLAVEPDSTTGSELRRMNDKPVPMTADGRAGMEAEYQHLVNVRRLEVATEIGNAADDGDLSENAAYDHAKDEQARLEGRIASLERSLRNAVIIVENAVSEIVQLGSKVTIEQNGEEDTYTILGPLEAAPAKGRISNECPVGRAVLNHRVGDTVDVHAPSGAYAIRIVAVHH